MEAKLFGKLSNDYRALPLVIKRSVCDVYLPRVPFCERRNTRSFSRVLPNKESINNLYFSCKLILKFYNNV